jgi:hypothetical protein
MGRRGRLCLARGGAEHYDFGVHPKHVFARAAARPLSAGALVQGATVAWVMAGCASEVPNYTPDADTGSRHAVITVERVEPVDTETPLTADAFAQFVRVPAYAEPTKVLGSAGVSRPLPAIDTCATADEFEDMNGPLAALGPVEFLEAGDVAISAGGSITALAAHAFPTVGDFASGVVYATRDQSAEPLPADAHYVIATQGSSVVSPMEVHEEAPRELEQVTVNGVPLADLREISSGEPFDLTWSVGEAGDVVLVEVAFQDGAPSLLWPR